MDFEMRNELEAKLRKMMESNMKEERDVQEPAVRPRQFSVIRRRKGQEDKRIYVK